MRITISVWARFHLFHLARELQNRQMLAAIYSTYPRFKLKDEKIDSGLLHCNPWIHTWYPVLAKLGLQESWPVWLLNRANSFHHQRHVAARLPECDVLVALSGAGLMPGRALQARGGKYVCDRGSAHIAWQDDCLAEEFARWGASYRRIDPALVANEVAEYEAADLVVVPSNFAARTFVDRGIARDKVTVVPFGVEPRHFYKAGEPPDDRFEVLFVGRLDFRKGIPYLLEAFQRFKHPRKRLTIIGQEQPRFRAYLAEQNLTDVEILGTMGKEGLRERMSHSHVMVLPSLEEGMALVQGEAMACGCPVIASRNTGAEDLISDGREGFIVPTRDASAICDRLTRLADEPYFRNEMSEHCLRRVKELSGWQNYADRYVDLCRQLVDG